MKDSIIVDIDGTIANCSHRLHHIKGMSDEAATFEADWDAFYADCMDDTAIEPVCDLVRSLIEQDWVIILMTGRSDLYREETERWLAMHDIWYDMLLMRKHGDHTDDEKIKRVWYRMLKRGQISLRGMDVPKLAIEDRKRVVEMWREEGLVCLQCAKGEF